MPFIPSWKRVTSAVPDIFEKMLDAVDSDYNEHSSDQIMVSSTSSVLKKQLIGHLEVIYQFDKNVDAIADKIISELELDEQKSFEIKDKNKWTHDDVIFITYGDSIKNDNELPLKTLNKFLKNFLLDTVTGVHILPFYPFSSDDGFSVIDY